MDNKDLDKKNYRISSMQYFDENICWVGNTSSWLQIFVWFWKLCMVLHLLLLKHLSHQPQHLRNSNWFTLRLFLLLNPFLSTLTIFLASLDENKPHSMMLPSPCFPDTKCIKTQEICCFWQLKNGFRSFLATSTFFHMFGVEINQCLLPATFHETQFCVTSTGSFDRSFHFYRRVTQLCHN